VEDFEWDDAKASLNLEKHGIGFNDAAGALQGLTLTRSVKRHGETRYSSICNNNGLAIVVIWTPRKDAIRIISARRARNDEREKYRQALSQSAQTR
jgi:uncharacterized DUF497 family protein